MKHCNWFLKFLNIVMKHCDWALVEISKYTKLFLYSVLYEQIFNNIIIKNLSEQNFNNIIMKNMYEFQQNHHYEEFIRTKNSITLHDFAKYLKAKYFFKN